jgi:hypothetical protein
MNINIGDTVTFEARGKINEGVVTRVRVKRSRKLARFGVAIERSFAHRMVAEITIDKFLWTVPCDHCKVKGKALPGEVVEARQRAQAVKSSISNRIAERKNRNYEAARTANMLYIESGTPIEVCYKDVGWTKVTFLRHNSSGGVVFRDRWGRERKVGATYARNLPTPTVEVPAPVEEVREPSIDLLGEFGDWVVEEA